jgi:hypothetical protein
MFPGRACGKHWTFTRVPQYEFVGVANEEVMLTFKVFCGMTETKDVTKIFVQAALREKSNIWNLKHLTK